MLAMLPLEVLGIIMESVGGVFIHCTENAKYLALSNFYYLDFQ